MTTFGKRIAYCVLRKITEYAIRNTFIADKHR